jgi:hypothetical protein
MKPKKNRKPGPLDNCQSPSYALDPLIAPLKAANIHCIWECASGEGYLSEAIAKAGFDVRGTDIMYDEKYDFFEYEPDFEFDTIVTNPPYSVKYEWIERCYEFEKPWALLMPVEAIAAKKAARLFKMFGVQVIVMWPRVNFKMPNKGWQGSAQFPTMWYTFGLELEKDLMFERIRRT